MSCLCILHSLELRDEGNMARIADMAQRGFVLTWSISDSPGCNARTCHNCNIFLSRDLSCVLLSSSCSARGNGSPFCLAVDYPSWKNNLSGSWTWTSFVWANTTSICGGRTFSLDLFLFIFSCGLPNVVDCELNFAVFSHLPFFL